MFARINRRASAGFMAIAMVISQVAVVTPSFATNSSTTPGNYTNGCSVNWQAKSHLSHSLTQDYNGNGTIEGEEVYSNQGYIQEVSSRSSYPAVNGPGDFLLHHWTNSNTSVGFRLPFATDHVMNDVTVTVKTESANLALGQAIAPMGLAKYVAIDGNPKYTTELPAPTTVEYGNGTITMKWATIPANSANIFNFSGNALDGAALNPASSYYIGASLSATYTQGQGCEVSVPAPPAPNPVDPCKFATYGRTVWNLDGGDIDARDKYDENGSYISGTDFEGEINADGWGPATSPTFRLYGGTRTALNNVDMTWKPTQGFDFTPNTSSVVITGTPAGMGMLYPNGFVAAVDGADIGTPTLNPDGSISLHIKHMPANSAVVFTVSTQADGNHTSFSMNSTFTADREECRVSPVKPPLTIQKVDQDGKLLPGATFEGYSCTFFNNDPDWTCISLHDREYGYPWFSDGLTNEATTHNYFTDEIDMQATLAQSCSDRRVQHVVLLRETVAPAGYSSKNLGNWSAFCQTVNGWVSDGGALNKAIDYNNDGTIDITTTGIDSSYATTDGKTVTFKNYLIGKGGAPVVTPAKPVSVSQAVATSTPVSPVPTLFSNQLPYTGANGSYSPRGMFIALIAAILTYGVVYFAQNRRRYE